MPKGKKNATAEKEAPKKAKAKKDAITEIVKCKDCGKTFTPSKFTPYQQFCHECGKAHKMARIKARNVFRKKVASLRNFETFMPKTKEDEVNVVKGKLSKASTSQRFKFFRSKYPTYVDHVKKG